jgi:excisionase family DNA binding protein
VAKSSLTHSRHLVSINQAAEYASVSSKTIRRRISDGTIRGYRMGRRCIRVDLAEVDRALFQTIPTTDGARHAS